MHELLAAIHTLNIAEMKKTDAGDAVNE